MEWRGEMTEPATSAQGPAEASVVPRDLLVEGTGHRLGRCSAALGSDGGANLFSGVFVRYRDRPFVLTAAHCLAAIRNWRSLRLISGNLRLAQRPPPLRKARGCKDDGPFDIAFLELEPQFAASLGADWIEQAQMHSRGLKAGLTVCLRGSPAERAARVSERPVGVSRRDVVFETHVVDPPALAIDPPVHEVDLFMEFDPDRVRDLLTGKPVAPPSPKGMSGGGVFALRKPSPDELWNPQLHVQLVGIQSAVLGGRAHCLRAKKIELALSMLEDYCEGR